MRGSYGVWSVEESKTKTKLKIKAFRLYFLSSIHFGHPTTLNPATSLVWINEPYQDKLVWINSYLHWNKSVVQLWLSDYQIVDFVECISQREITWNLQGERCRVMYMVYELFVARAIVYIYTPGRLSWGQQYGGTRWRTHTLSHLLENSSSSDHKLVKMASFTTWPQFSTCL